MVSGGHLSADGREVMVRLGRHASRRGVDTGDRWVDGTEPMNFDMIADSHGNWSPYIPAPLWEWRLLYALDLIIPLVMIATIYHMTVTPQRNTRAMRRFRDIGIVAAAVHFVAIPLSQWSQIWQLRLGAALSIVTVYAALNYVVWRARHDD